MVTTLILRNLKVQTREDWMKTILFMNSFCMGKLW